MSRVFILVGALTLTASASAATPKVPGAPPFRSLIVKGWETKVRLGCMPPSRKHFHQSNLNTENKVLQIAFKLQQYLLLA